MLTRSHRRFHGSARTALTAVGIAAIIVGCGGGDDASTTTASGSGTVSTETVSSETQIEADASSGSTAASETAEATADTDSSAANETTLASSGRPDRGGPGGGVSPDSVTTIDELNELINEAYGDPGLGLHRGHQPVEAVEIEVLGISHDEMHVRMDEGQNLAAIATDLGIEPQTLIDALVASWSPAIDNLVASGEITDEQAAAYRDALTEAFTFRVTWNGTDDTPTFGGV